MSDHQEIDVRFQGRERSIVCHRIGDAIVDPGPESSCAALVAALAEPPRRILLTHIHLDHAGATGALARRWPDAEVWVHERGAPHLIDPAKLIASATRLYGDRMGELWGEIVPVPAERVRVLRGGERIEGFQVEYTPGHASHHACFLHLDSGLAFVGDVAGVRIGGGPTIPPTPPPDIDVEAWEASIELVRAWTPTALAVTHGGTFSDVDAHLDEVRQVLREHAELARTVDAGAFEAAVRARLQGVREGGSYFSAMPPETLHAGLARYWAKRGPA